MLLSATTEKEYMTRWKLSSFYMYQKGKKPPIEFVRNGKEIKKDIKPKVERTYQLGYYSSASGENSNVIGELIYGGALEKSGRQTRR